MNRTHRIAGLWIFAALLVTFTALPGFAAEGRRVVNINSANAEQLALLPRVGPSVAQRIVDFRKENGPFKSPEDLMLVQGIGEKTYQLLKPYLAVSGETTLKEKVKASRPAGGSEKPEPEKKKPAETKGETR
ncbi:MAG TPA: helix-hairpin-helix domain-containing protein [Thermoanaerobaculia bacterium]|nr:helix-hairpin-helix domain-containing protein [Thermoanaerobaculia bacterium]